MLHYGYVTFPGIVRARGVSYNPKKCVSVRILLNIHVVLVRRYNANILIYVKCVWYACIPGKALHLQKKNFMKIITVLV